MLVGQDKDAFLLHLLAFFHGGGSGNEAKGESPRGISLMFAIILPRLPGFVARSCGSPEQQRPWGLSFLPMSGTLCSGFPRSSTKVGEKRGMVLCTK